MNAQVKLGDRVCSPMGNIGTVIHLYTNLVGIRWAFVRVDGRERATQYNVADLRVIEVSR